MNSLNVIERLLVKATEKRKISGLALMKSYISLFLAFSILAVATFSWFTVNDTAKVTSSAVEVSASSGLRVNHGEDLSSNIVLSADVKLAEASSVDGRNMFFPTTGAFPDENSNMNTSEMIFREGNVGDKNTKYYYNNFSMQVEADNTEVYVKEYSVKVTTANNEEENFDGSEGNHQECPIRIAFIQDSSQKPVVIDPTALVANYTNDYDAVEMTNLNGQPYLKKTDTHAFSEYYYSTDNPLFKIENAGDTLDATMVIWLEGTGGNCDRYVGGTVEINIQLESNWDYMDKIKFIDDTVGDDDTSVKHWIDNSDNTSTDCIVLMSYVDVRTNTQKSVVMSKSPYYDKDHTWMAALPEDVIEDITFARYNPEKQEVWNIWYTEDGVNDRLSDKAENTWGIQNLQEERIILKDGQSYRSSTYRATRGNGYGITDKDSERRAPCIGYWEIDENDTPIEQTSDWYLTGSFNNWAEKDGGYRFNAGTNKYSLTKELSAGAYYFKLYDDKSTGVKYYSKEGASFNDTASNLELVQSDGTNSGYMTLDAKGGRYTFEIDTSDPDNYKLTVKHQSITPATKSVTIIVRDNMYNKGNEQEYVVVFSNGQSSDKLPKTDGSNGQTYTYQGKITIPEGATVSRIKNNTQNVSFNAEPTEFEIKDGDIRTFEIDSQGNGRWI